MSCDIFFFFLCLLLNAAQFKRAVRIATGHNLSENVLDTVFKLFDMDGDNCLSHKEFVAVMENRVLRGLKVRTSSLLSFTLGSVVANVLSKNGTTGTFFWAAGETLGLIFELHNEFHSCWRDRLFCPQVQPQHGFSGYWKCVKRETLKGAQEALRDSGCPFWGIVVFQDISSASLCVLWFEENGKMQPMWYQRIYTTLCT